MPTQIYILGESATLGPGETHFWEYWFDEFIDAGVCHASIATDNQWKGHLEVTQQGMIGTLRMENFIPRWGSSFWRYTVSVRNDDQSAVAYHLRVARLQP